MLPAIFKLTISVRCFLTVKEGDGVCADGVQSHHLFAVFGAAAFVFLFPPEEGSARRCRESLTGVFLHFCHAVSAVKLLVHPTPHTHIHTETDLIAEDSHGKRLCVYQCVKVRLIFLF